MTGRHEVSPRRELPKAAIPILEARGHEAVDYRVVGEKGSPDLEIVREVIKRRAAILTTDRDFFHTHGKASRGHFGILVVALKQPTREALIRRMEWFLDHIAIDKVPGRTFQLRDRTWVVYPPLDDAFDPPDPTAGPLIEI